MPGQSSSSYVWRIINLLLGIFFSLAAYVNVNDDDWYLWVPLYKLPALLCVTAAVQPSFSENTVWQTTTSIVFLSSLLYGMYQISALLRTISSVQENPLVYEEGREMVGLLIILAWASITKFSPLARNQDNKNVIKVLLYFTCILALVPLFAWLLCFISDWHKHFGHCNSHKFQT